MTLPCLHPARKKTLPTLTSLISNLRSSQRCEMLVNFPVFFTQSRASSFYIPDFHLYSGFPSKRWLFFQNRDFFLQILYFFPLIFVFSFTVSRFFLQNPCYSFKIRVSFKKLSSLKKIKVSSFKTSFSLNRVLLYLNWLSLNRKEKKETGFSL